MDIKLIERDTRVLSSIVGSQTFKILESSFLYMRIDVVGMAVLISRSQKEDGEMNDPESIKVKIPEGKTPVICLNTGKAQFLKLDEKVEIVVLDVHEIIQEKGE